MDIYRLIKSAIVPVTVGLMGLTLHLIMAGFRVYNPKFSNSACYRYEPHHTVNISLLPVLQSHRQISTENTRITLRVPKGDVTHAKYVMCHFLLKMVPPCLAPTSTCLSLSGLYVHKGSLSTVTWPQSHNDLHTLEVAPRTQLQPKHERISQVRT